MKISIFGTGYVGLVTGVCLADLGHDVVCCDIDKNKIEELSEGRVPFFEPNLESLVKKNIRAQRISFTDNTAQGIDGSEIVFIAVGTPSKKNGEVDLSFVEQVAKNIGKHLRNYAVIVNKSTVPVGTGKKVGGIIKKYYKGYFDVASNPEFLREGEAIFDFMNPERIVIGTNSEKSGKILNLLYSSFKCPIVNTTIETAEMVKYASNAFLATKISFINEIANICEKVGADVDDVSYAMGLDSRIGDKFLKAGIGYGGSCFPKDVRGLKNIALKNDYEFHLLKSVITVNHKQKVFAIDKARELLGKMAGKKICVWGLAFKSNTDDFRESLAIDIIKLLHKEKVIVSAYDPEADYDKIAEKSSFKSKVDFFDNSYEALKGCDALIIATDWNEFKDADLAKMRMIMKKPNVIDGRNIYDKEKMTQLGFKYKSVGR